MNTKIGTTFSHTFAKYLKLDPVQSVKDLISQKFDIIRLCCYWNEIQPEKNTYDFSAITQLLDICEKNNQDVILTVGMKAPRWPEFFIPKWIQSDDPQTAFPFVLKFIEETIQKLKDYSCIKYWQVENEPLDPAWPTDRTMLLPDVKKEIDLIKSIDDSRKLLVSMWGSSDLLLKTFAEIKDTSDIIGIDIYYKMHHKKFAGIDFYFKNRVSSENLKKMINNSSIPVWITELQAEPWESGMTAYKQEKTKSMSPAILIENFRKAKALNPAAILLWGSEYWLWRKLRGDDSYWKAVTNILQNKN